MNDPQTNTNLASRRAFLKGAAGAATAAAIAPVAHAQGSQMLRLGTIGCGNRGAMDVRDFLTGSQDVELVAMADVFEDYIDRAQQKLQDPNYFGGKWDKAKDKFKVKPDTTFLGVDAYKRLLEMDDVDIVLLLTPPGFRAMHMRAAVEAGKHVFFEKPAAVDATSIRSIIESGEIAKQKGLSIVGGTQQRRMPHYVEVMKRVMDGAIGPITAGYASWHWANTDWHYEPRQPEWSDTEWQIRCWPYFTWLSGDHIVEQHVHNLDVMNWALGNPINCLGRGGRQVRTSEGYGNRGARRAQGAGVVQPQRVLHHRRERLQVRGPHARRRREAVPGPDRLDPQRTADQRSRTHRALDDDRHHGPHVQLHRQVHVVELRNERVEGRPVPQKPRDPRRPARRAGRHAGRDKGGLILNPNPQTRWDDMDKRSPSASDQSQRPSNVARQRSGSPQRSGNTKRHTLRRDRSPGRVRVGVDMQTLVTGGTPYLGVIGLTDLLQQRVHTPRHRLPRG
ncbi:MAG: Gfo/Idh/MocA family protein [Planctomycetota bacterium]|jgi:predicted dehydrogenase